MPIKLVWRQLHSNSFALHVEGQRDALLHVVHDTRSGLWRVRHRDGSLSDIVNLARAKDAAEVIARRAIETVPQPEPASPMRQTV